MRAEYVVLLKCRSALKKIESTSERDQLLKGINEGIDKINSSYAADVELSTFFVERLLSILEKNKIKLFSTKTNRECFK